MLVRLNTAQNVLLFTDSFLLILICTIGLGTFSTGLFGMNLDNTDKLQERRMSFVAVNLLALAMMAAIYWGILHYMKWREVLPFQNLLGLIALNSPD